MNAVHVDDDPVDKYSLPEQQLQEDFENEIVVEETHAQEAYPQMHNVARETPVSFAEESFEEPPKKTYASIVCKTFSIFGRQLYFYSVNLVLIHCLCKK